MTPSFKYIEIRTDIWENTFFRNKTPSEIIKIINAAFNGKPIPPELKKYIRIPPEVETK